MKFGIVIKHMPVEPKPLKNVITVWQSCDGICSKADRDDLSNEVMFGAKEAMPHFR